MNFTLKNILDYSGYTQLIEIGIHIGHSIKNTLNFNSWLVYFFRRNVAILSLILFRHHFRAAIEIINYTSQFHNPVWFVNLNAFYDKLIKFSALKCGEFFVSAYWIRGMISNFRYVSTSFRKLKFYSSIVFTKKDSNKAVNFDFWPLTRFSWPRTAFVSGVHSSYLAIRECLSLSIPSLGIVDSDAFSQAVAVAIPGNDETIDSLMFYNDLASTLILKKKFKSVVLWFINLRRRLRMTKFSVSLRKKLNSFFRFFSSDYSSFKRGMEFFFHWGSQFPENVNDASFTYLSDDEIFKVAWPNFEFYLKNNFVFWRSFAFLTHFWSGGRNFFQVKRNFLENYMMEGIRHTSNKISFSRSGFYFRHSLMRPRGRFFLIHNRYWTKQGSSHRRFPKFRYMRRFFARKGLYWALYTYFFLSEGISIFLLDGKFFRIQRWSRFLPKLFLLTTLSSALNFPVSAAFLDRRPVLSLIKSSYKSHSKIRYIAFSLYKIIKFMYNSLIHPHVYISGLSVYFYNIWKDYKKILFLKKLNHYYSTIKRIFPYYMYSLKYKLYHLETYYKHNSLTSKKRLIYLRRFAFKLKLEIIKIMLEIKLNFSRNSKNSLFFRNYYKLYNNYVKFLSNLNIYHSLMESTFSKNVLFSVVYRRINKEVLFRNKKFLIFMNNKLFYNRIKNKAIRFQRSLKYKYRFFLSRISYPKLIDKKLLRDFSNWIVKIKSKSLYLLKITKYI